MICGGTNFWADLCLVLSWCLILLFWCFWWVLTQTETTLVENTRLYWRIISNHGARNDLLLVCVFLGAEGVGAVRTCRPPGKTCVAHYILILNAAPTQFSCTDFLQQCLGRDPNEEDNIVKVPLFFDYIDLQALAMPFIASYNLLQGSS